MSKYSYKVILPKNTSKIGYIGVSDDNAGEYRLYELHQKYGNLKVEVYDRNEIFGVGYNGAEPVYKTTITELVS